MSGRIAPTARAVVLVAFALFFGVPLVWLVLAATRTGSDLQSGPWLAVGDLHNVLVAWRNLDAFDDHVFRRWLGNSLLYSLSATSITLATAIPAGYALALGTFRGRVLILQLTLVAMLVPASSLVLPVFLELNAVHLVGNPLSIILPFAFFPFGVYLAYLYYSTALPRRLLEAARVDGCGELQAFVRIALPLARPVVALVFFFSFVADWNTFTLPYAILPDSRQFPVQVGLTDLFRSTGPAVALASLIAAIPVAIVFLASQRALTRGLPGGGATE